MKLMMKPLQKLVFSFCFLFSASAWSAACCGGGISMPALVTGDDKAVISASYSYSQIVVDNVDSNGVWRRWPEHQQVRTLKLEGAHVFSDRWQVGASIPIIEREYLGNQHAGFGDIGVNLGYEYLPDWEYHPVRPKGLGFLNLQLPTGKAKMESENGGLDTRGNGFLSLGVGTLLSKNFSQWDIFLTTEVHRSFAKEINTTQIQGTLKPGWGGSLGLGAGYNTARLRIGPSITWFYEDPIAISGNFSSVGSLERYATGAMSLSYLVDSTWVGTLTYSDQTLFGSPANTSLSRSVLFQLQRKWLR